MGGVGNYVFQGIMGRQLSKIEFGFVNSTISFINLMSLPLAIVAAALVHYIAHFRASSDEARLQSLLLGSQRYLLKATVVGTLVAVLLANPLSLFFEFPRSGLMVAALVTVLLGMWSGFAVALAQGMSWFRRLAIFGLIAVGLRLAFGWYVTKKFSNTAEAAVSATAFSLLANFALLYWWKDLFKKAEKTEAVSPWNREFGIYLIASAACVGGTFLFSQGDLLVAQKYFGKGVDDIALGHFTAAGVLGRSIPSMVGPMLIVLFTSRSGSKVGAAATDQKIMLALYGAGLLCGAVGLITLRNLLVKFIFGKYTPEAAAMVPTFAFTMVFVGFIQAIATFSLASRWFKLALLYGFAGLCYWLTLLFLGKTPEKLLQMMPIGAGIAFVIMLIGWFITTRDAKKAA
ncbi:MAG: hypothetical protein JWM68_604 [Verrucomicrobiales bacterium]|nr:hypothetical protein [Verrucomicrobiales bacterium]